MKIASELQSHLRPIESLILLPGNPRQGDIGAISESLARFGQLKPVVIDDQGVILAGNHTYLAAKALGWPRLAAVVAEELEGPEKAAFALADNRLSDLASYDSELLLAMSTHVYESTGSLDGTGYDLEYLEELRRDIDEPFDASPGDERYTPAWVFEGMGVEFDIDLAAPPGGVSWIPAQTYWTKTDDSLTKDWRGLFSWCNPPFSRAAEFGTKWLDEIDDGVWLGPISHHAQYVIGLCREAQRVWLSRRIEFERSSGFAEGIAFPVFLVGMGERGGEALDNLAQASPEGVLLRAV